MTRAADPKGPAVLASAEERWLAARRQLVTASDAAAILGEDPRRGALAVYAEKVGALPTEEDNDYMAYGRDVEAAIGKAYARKTGRPVVELGRHVLQVHPELRWLASTLDFQTSGTVLRPAPPPAAGAGPLEAKAVAAYKAAEWADDAEPPIHFQIQVQVQMACTGAQWGSLCALVGGLEVRWRDIKRNDRFLSKALPRLEEFHIRVQRREPPEEVDALPRTGRALRALYPVGNGETALLEHADLEAANRLDAIRQQVHDGEEALEELSNKLRRRMGDATFGALPDGSYLTLKVSNNNGYVRKPYTYRSLGRYRPRLPRRNKR